MKRYEFHIDCRDRKGGIKHRVWTNGGLGYCGKEYWEAVSKLDSDPRVVGYEVKEVRA